MSTFTKVVKGLGGFLLAPLDSLWGLGKQIYSWRDIKNYYFPARQRANVVQQSKDKRTQSLPATLTLSRLATIAAATLCVLGFLGALVSPIPGTTALYSLSVMGIAKAAGITLGWSIFGKTLGAMLGGIVDFFVYKEMKIMPKKVSAGKFILETPLKVGLLGEGGPKLFVTEKRLEEKQKQYAPPVTASTDSDDSDTASHSPPDSHSESSTDSNNSTRTIGKTVTLSSNSHSGSSEATDSATPAINIPSGRSSPVSVVRPASVSPSSEDDAVQVVVSRAPSPRNSPSERE